MAQHTSAEVVPRDVCILVQHPLMNIDQQAQAVQSLLPKPTVKLSVSISPVYVLLKRPGLDTDRPVLALVHMNVVQQLLVFNLICVGCILSKYHCIC